ncbi:MAG: TolC family protein [Bacteroidales bacterium]|nr:TolC family protein [Bacteroidales bacterium]
MVPTFSIGQTLLTLKAAIDTTLRNSFDIRIAANNVNISKINNNAGVAGALPTVSASIADNQSLTNVNQELNSGTEIKKSNAAANSLTSSVTAGMLLFNGFKVMATRERLDLLQKQSEVLLNSEIQNSIAAVMTAYFDIVRQQQYLKIIRATLDVSKNKLDIIKRKKDVGMANDADYLQAMIDVNTAEQTERNQLLVIDQAKTGLQQIMSQNRYYSFDVTDSISLDKSLQINNILAYLKQNPQYHYSEHQIRINEQIVKEVAAQRYPSLRFNTGVNFNRSQSAAGFTLLNQTYGPYAGLSLQVPIYNGNAYKVQKETAVYNLQNSKLQQENLLNDLNASAVRVFQSYSTNLEQVESQQKSLEMAQQLINVVMQRFSLNQATILDVKAAQASYESAGYQLVNLSFAAKISEIELKRLTYQLGN